MSSPSNARRPVSISYSTQPNAQMSLRLSAVAPLRLLRRHVRRRAENHADAGHHRGRRDRRRRCDVDCAGRWLPARASFARPKSSTFTVPSGVTLMFAGFRSRWMIPCSCAASSASAICRAIGSASSSGIGPRAIRSASVVALDQFQHERVDRRRCPRSRRSRRCADDSARRAPALRAGSARGGPDRRRTRRAGSSARRRDPASCRARDRPRPCRRPRGRRGSRTGRGARRR